MICFNLVIERLLISGVIGISRDLRAASFNLVIERLLISGRQNEYRANAIGFVSISLSSGFSFQVPGFLPLQQIYVPCFNLVIERLLISGTVKLYRDNKTVLFQSRYRAASHFRNGPV